MPKRNLHCQQGLSTLKGKYHDKIKKGITYLLYLGFRKQLQIEMLLTWGEYAYRKKADADPDPAIFIIDLQDANKKLIFKKDFYCILLFEGTFISFFKDKSQKEVTKQ
jgi:hypothetical protein